MMLGERKDADCYFYYYSSCSKGPNCPFRHEPAALRNETVCVYWKAGKCSKNNCIFRHMEIHKQRDKIPCYFETQPTGCKKAHCPFFHSEVRTQEEVEKVEGVIMPVSSSNQTGAATPPNATNALPTPPTTMPKPPKEVIVNLHDGESDQESIPSPKKKESDEGREEAKEEEEEEEEGEEEDEEEEEEEIIQTIVLEEQVEEVDDEDDSQLSRDKILSTSDDLRLLLSRKPANRNRLHPSPPANQHAAALTATNQDGTGRRGQQKAAAVVVEDYEASIEQKLAQFKASATKYSIPRVSHDAKLNAEDPEDRLQALRRRKLAQSQETGLHQCLKLQNPEGAENLKLQGVSQRSKVTEAKELGLHRRLKLPKQADTENLGLGGVSQRLQAPEPNEEDRFEVLKRRRLAETKETGIQQRLKFKPQVNEAEEDFSLQGESQESTTLDAETLDPEDRFEFLKRRRLAETREVGVKKRLGAIGGKPDISQRLQHRNLTKSDVAEDRKRLRLTETDHGSLADNSTLQFQVSGSEEEGLNLTRQDRKLPQNRLSGRELVRLSLRGDTTSVYKGETKPKNLLNRALTDAFNLNTTGGGGASSEKTGALKGRLGKTSSVSVPPSATSAGSSSVKTRLGGAVSSSSSSSAPSSSSSSSSSSASSSTLDFKIKSLSEIKASRSTTTTTTTTTAASTTTISPPAITSTTSLDLEEELLLEGDILDSDEEIDEDQLLL